MTSIMQWTTLIHAMIEVLNNYEYEDSVVIKASNLNISKYLPYPLCRQYQLHLPTTS